VGPLNRNAAPLTLVLSTRARSGCGSGGIAICKSRNTKDIEQRSK
jgi:hypothetical protein